VFKAPFASSSCRFKLRLRTALIGGQPTYARGGFKHGERPSRTTFFFIFFTFFSHQGLFVLISGSYFCGFSPDIIFNIISIRSRTKKTNSAARFSAENNRNDAGNRQEDFRRDWGKLQKNFFFFFQI